MELSVMTKSIAAVNDYSGSKLGFVVSQLGLVGSVGLGLRLVILRVRVSVLAAAVRQAWFSAAIIIFDAIVVAFTARKASCFSDTG